MVVSPKMKGNPLVDCPRLITQYTHTHTHTHTHTQVFRTEVIQDRVEWQVMVLAVICLCLVKCSNEI
jgi:ABC-type nickel/cobalt efflux system permease component RcnA